MAFIKLDCGLLDSSLWPDREAREVFLTALLMATPHVIESPMPQLEVRTLVHTGFMVPPGAYGFVPAAGAGIVRRAGLPADAGLAALERLGAVDPESRTPDCDGRRLVRIDGGFIVMNYAKYRNKDQTAAERARKYRAASRVTGVTDRDGAVTSRVTDRDVTHVEVDAEAEVEEEGEKRWRTPLPPSPPACSTDFMASASELAAAKAAPLPPLPPRQMPKCWPDWRRGHPSVFIARTGEDGDPASWLGLWNDQGTSAWEIFDAMAAHLADRPRIYFDAACAWIAANTVREE